MSHSKLRPTEVRITTPQDQVVRAGLVVVSVGLLIIGLGFLFKTDWVLRLWPVKEGPLSYLFISSIILAQATALGWTAKTLELNYARGGVLGFAAMNAGFVLFAASRYRQFPDTPLIGWIVVCGLLFLGGMALS